MSLFKSMGLAAATGMLPALLTPIMGQANADKIAPHLKNALNTIGKKKLNPDNSSMKDLLKVIEETGMTKQQLQASINSLDNTFIGKALNSFAPNLTNSLRGIGMEAYNSMGNIRPNPIQSAPTGGITSKYPTAKK